MAAGARGRSRRSGEHRRRHGDRQALPRPRRRGQARSGPTRRTPIPRILRDVLIGEPPADELVGVVHGDESVRIHVGVAALEAADELRREPRGRRVAAYDVAVEGVLSRVRRGEHDEPAGVELLPRVHGGVGLDLHPLRERAAVAAVEEQHLPARARPEQELVHDRRRDRRRAEPVPPRVARGEVEPAGLVLETVAGEVEEDQVAALGVDEELFDRLGDLGRPAVHDRRHIEPAACRVGEHAAERGRILPRRGEALEPFIVVASVGDDERPAALRRWVRLHRLPPRRRRDVRATPRALGSAPRRSRRSAPRGRRRSRAPAGCATAA